jgi:hypothetical protein
MANMLTDQDHSDLDIYLGNVLTDHAAGRITKGQAVADLAHVIGALDQGNKTEVVGALAAARERGATR